MNKQIEQLKLIQEHIDLHQPHHAWCACQELIEQLEANLELYAKGLANEPVPPAQGVTHEARA